MNLPVWSKRNLSQNLRTIPTVRKAAHLMTVGYSSLPQVMTVIQAMAAVALAARLRPVMSRESPPPRPKIRTLLSVFDRQVYKLKMMKKIKKNDERKIIYFQTSLSVFKFYLWKSLIMLKT